MIRWWNLLRRPFVSAATRKKREQELAEELEHHLELRTELHRSRGLSEEQARRAARLEFGSPEVVKERIRQGWSWMWLEHWKRDLRTGARALRSSPAYTVTVLLTLCVGLGALGAVASFLHAVAFRSLPYPDEESLVVARAFRARDAERSFGVSYLDFRDVVRNVEGVTATALVGRTSAMVDEGAGKRIASVGTASSTLLETLGIAPLRGRFFTTQDDVTAGARPVVLTQRTWISKFGRDEGVLGRLIQIDEEPAEVVGIASQELFAQVDDPVEYILPLSFQGDPGRPGSANASRAYRLYEAAVVRLPSGGGPETIAAKLSALTESYSRQHPEIGEDLQWDVQPLRQALFGDTIFRAWLLCAMAGVVLAVAAVNVTNLFLARLLVQSRQLALRFALGALGRDIFRQLFAENLILALIGGASGVLLASWTVDLVFMVAPASVPRFSGMGVGPAVATIAFVGAVAIGLACAALGTLVTLRNDPARLITNGSRSTTQAGWPERLRRLLVAGQVALTLILLVTAGLLVRSLIHLENSSAGYDVRQIATAELSLAAKNLQGEWENPVRMNAALARLKERLLGRADVVAVGFAQCVPLGGNENNTQFDWVGSPHGKETGLSAQLRFVDGDYFRVLGIPIKSGRAFEEQDIPGRTPVALINESFASTHLKGESPLGQRLKLGWGGDAPKEIVGVVGNVRHRSLGDDARPEIYVPQNQFANSQVTLVAKLRNDLEISAEELRREIIAADPDIAVLNISTLERLREASLALPRFLTTLLIGFASTALMLTAVGVYGVMSYDVAQRTRELGVRLALGARPSRLVLAVSAKGLRLISAGTAFGTAGCMVATSWLSPFLFEVSRYDLATYGSIILILVTVGLAGCVSPAIRAARVDPCDSLRAE